MMAPTARKRKSPEISEAEESEHIDPNMTVKEFMESQMKRFVAQISEKANNQTRKLKSDFEASKLDYMDQFLCSLFLISSFLILHCSCS